MSNRHWMAIAALTIAGCAASPRTIRMMTSPTIPAAQGMVTASSAANGNTALRIEVRHLAPPERVASGATIYVVWAQALGQDTSQNLGALRVDSDLHGTLNTVTPLQSFTMFITAEPSPTTLMPSSSQLLTASIQR
ncbi:MAG: hypothetical protein IPI49_09245 [Myxococcales bacterium]|nr:hypothetical protein [Myxococcales bacterium]